MNVFLMDVLQSLKSKAVILSYLVLFPSPMQSLFAQVRYASKPSEVYLEQERDFSQLAIIKLSVKIFFKTLPVVHYLYLCFHVQ